MTLDELIERHSELGSRMALHCADKRDINTMREADGWLEDTRMIQKKLDYVVHKLCELARDNGHLSGWVSDVLHNAEAIA